MDPYPQKHPAVILAGIRTAIEPSLSAAGFEFSGRNKPQIPRHLYLDYTRGNDLFCVSWENRESPEYVGFTAELIRDSGDIITIAEADLTDIPMFHLETDYPEIMSRVELLIERVNEFLNHVSSSQ